MSPIYNFFVKNKVKIKRGFIILTEFLFRKRLEEKPK